MLVICMQVFQSLEMEITQTNHIQHLKSASTLMWSLTAWYLMLSLSWSSKEGEHTDGGIRLLQAEKQIEKGQSGNEMAAAPSGLCPEGARCSEPLPRGTRAAFPAGITHRFGLGLSGTRAQKEMFYFIPCIKNRCAAGRWVTVVVKGCARNKVG